MEPPHVAQPGGMRLLKAVLGLVIAMDVVIAAVLLAFVNLASAAITFAAMLATLLIVWLILPRRYEIWPARLSIVFPAWTWNVDYHEIATVRAAHWTEAYAFWGMRFATAAGQAVTVVRHNANLFTRPNLVISPADREQFLRELESAMGG